MRFGQIVLRMTRKKGFVQFSWKAHCFAFLERLWGQCDDFDNFDAHKFYLAKTFYAWSEKERFVQFLWIAHCFSVLARISGQCDYFKNFDAHKFDLAKTCCAWPEKSVLYNFHGKRTVLPFWREFTASVTILTTLTLTNAIWPKRAAYDLKRAFGTIFMESALFSLFGENLGPVWRFWQLWRSQMRFGQNVLRMTWKRALCTIFMDSALFSRFEDNFGPVWRSWQLWSLKMRFGQNVLRLTWKKRSVQFSWKAYCFPVLKKISGQCDDFENFDAQKYDWGKTCCAWPETSVLYNFHGKRTVFPFCSIFMKSALFSLFGENLRAVWRFWELWR